MSERLYVQVALPVPLYATYDYEVPQRLHSHHWCVGLRVSVPWGRQERIGLIVGISKQSQFSGEVKQLVEVLDEVPVMNESIWRLCLMSSDYYHYPIGEALFTALPTYFRKGKALFPTTTKTESVEPSISKHQQVQLNNDQQQAVQAIVSVRGFQTFMLRGVTGSGKTEVYWSAMAEILASGKQVLVLVPEIGLTPQTIVRFKARFQVPVAVWHSGISDKKRAEAWLKAKTGEISVIIGTRSAIFTPFQQLGMIVVDEEHDLSFKQMSGFRYSARDLAVWRGHLENVPVVLGSATPSLETLHNVERGRYRSLELPNRANEMALPKVGWVDMKNRPVEGGLSPEVVTTIERHLKAGGQVLVFLNRRGYAPVWFCHACGWTAVCRSCDAKLVWYRSKKKLHCHHCARIYPVPQTCPQCAQAELIPVGVGTEQLMEVLQRLFPEVAVIQVDREVLSARDSSEQWWKPLQEGKVQLIVGTQMMAKGHDFPRLSLVVVVDADTGLLSHDFRAIERLGQLMIQVSGRAGRSLQQGEVLIQTHYPEHPLWQWVKSGDYLGFAEDLLKSRQMMAFPPFASMTLIRAEDRDETKVESFLKQIKTQLEKVDHNLICLGPVPAPMERRHGRYRGQLLLRSPERRVMQQALLDGLSQIADWPLAKRLRWSVDVDPVDMD